MRVLLINPPDELEAMFGVGKEFVQKYEPLGLLYIAAVARDAGHDVHVIDAHAQELTLPQLQQRIDEINPDVVGVSTLTCSGALVLELGQWIKKTFPHTLVILGNVHASVFAKQYVENNGCDVVVHGEGEYVFRDILNAHQNKTGFAEIPGITYLGDDGVAVQTSPGSVIEDLSALPLPARDLVDQKLYRLSEISNQNFVAEDGETAKTMVTSRGCMYRCAFCVVHSSRKPRYNDVIKAVDELELLQKEYNAAYVYLMDPLFFGNRKRVMAICDEIKRRKLTIRWGCDAHIKLMTPEIVRAVAEANCYELSLGIESGVQRLLDIVNKGTTLKKAEQAVRMIRDNSDIHLEGLFILGLPTETPEETLQTIRFAKSLPLDMAQFSILCPYPGSPLFFELTEKGELDSGIREDGSLDADVWKRYSSYICFTDMEPIWTPTTMTAEQLRALQKKANRSFFMRPSQIIKQLRRLNHKNVFKAAKIAIKGFF